MPPSQLKQLKASLRENGVLGPQKSKKQQKASGKDAQKRLQRSAALEGIRDKFNPFEVKAPARRPKHEFVSSKVPKANIGRPGVTRGLGEERRRETLLRELQSKNKVGGLLDRRFGENDPTLTPEERAAERFARQNERKMRKTSMFNLEDESEEELALTHGGRSLDFGDVPIDDYEQDELDAIGGEEESDQPRKRIRLDDDGKDQASDDAILERKKTKNEVMQEIIAKSKMYKAERQAAKADDEDLRLELDQGMNDLYETLRANPPAPKSLPTPPSDSDPQMDPARAAMIAGKSREEAEKEYEANIRQMKMDARSKPTLRTKTEEEKAIEEAERLQDLEKKRLRRMQGEAESSDDEGTVKEANEQAEEEADDAEAFGLPAPQPFSRPELEVEEEDDFVLDDDLVASGSDLEMATDDESVDSEIEYDGDDDFINGLVLPQQASSLKLGDATTTQKELAFTYPCPQTHAEFLELVEDKDVADIPTIVQRIRALYHKGLAEGNQQKLGQFIYVLVDHIAYMANHESAYNAIVVEALIRHLHSMAKGQPQEAAAAFRARLLDISEKRPLALAAGDLMVLTAVSSIFPTSDQFHTVVTPAMLTIGRYLGQSSIQSLQDLGRGLYCCSLFLQYQQLAKRYMPEVVTYIVNAMAILSPTPIGEYVEGLPLNAPIRLPEKTLRLHTQPKEKTPLKASFRRLVQSSATDSATALLILHTAIRLTHTLADFWSAKTAFAESIHPLIQALSHLQTTPLPPGTQNLVNSTLAHLQSRQSSAITDRKPLLLHNHRPLAIKSSVPQFSDSYNPTKHNDPDIERSQLSRLKAEHKKERKGAMRELRKDANFIAREQLREKKERDDAYEKKFKRLVAEIQGEEGREAKEYEREKKRRKGKQ